MEKSVGKGLKRTAEEIRRNGLYRLIIALGMILFYSLYINKAFPASEGWHITYVELMKAGKFPYRDFYYYLPPLDLLISYVLWSLSAGSYLLYRCWRLLERIIIAQMVFSILCKRTKPANACLASLIGGIMYSACVYDLLGDYNQTGYVVLAVFAMQALGFAKAQSVAEKKKSAVRTGLALGILFFSKQTYFVATFLVFFAALSYLCWVEKDRNYGWYVLYAAAGTIVPIAILAVYLAVNQAIVPFVEQVFLNVDSKGSILSLILGSLYYLYADKNTLFFLAFLIVTCMYAYYYHRIHINAKIKGSVLAVFVILTAACAVGLKNSYWTSIHAMFTSRYLTGIAVLMTSLVPGIVHLLLSYCVKNGRIKDEHEQWMQSAFYLFYIAVYIVFLMINPKGLAGSLYESEDTFRNFCAIVQRLVNTGMVVMFTFLGRRCKVHGDHDSKQWFFLFCVCFACSYAQQMAAGSSLVASYYLIMVLPIFLAWLLSIPGKYMPLRNSVIIALSFLLILITGAQKTISSYRWWGWEELPIKYHNQSLDIEGMEGFRVDSNTKKIFEEITKLVKENSNADSTVLGYPHMVIFNQLADRPCLGRFVPVYFYDVAARKYVAEDVERIKENPPDIVIWQDIPGCYDAHESVFNQSDERMAQYRLEEWFAFAKVRDYVMVGQVGNIFVYKLKDNGIPVGYTYIERDQVNETASIINRFEASDMVNQLNKEADEYFNGDGTIDHPYRIANAEDFAVFADLVNRGALFIDKYFEQNADLDLSSVENWKPIGEWGAGVSFLGTYDGKGHVIRNIHCNEDTNGAYVGLFGTIGGIVMNLGIEDSYFAADYVGVFAVDGTHNSIILNCYSKNVVVEASAGAGITLNGQKIRIYNCWADNQIAAKSVYGIVREAYEIESCYCFNGRPERGGLVHNLDNSVHRANKTNSGVQRVCTYLNDWIFKKRVPQLVEWKMEAGEIVFD